MPPLPAEEEGDEFSCDGRDNDCDIAIDEGLDNDQDGFGCEPNSENCNRTSADIAYRCARDNGVEWDCNDRDASVGPGLEEVCDYKDNNCNTEVDEGVRNECGHCEPTCDVTQFGGEGGLPLNPTEENSSSVSLNDDGTLTVFSEVVDVQFAWIAVDQGGVVSKIDTRTGEKLDGIVPHWGHRLRRFLKGSKPIMVAFGASRTSVERATPATGVLEPQC